MSADGVLRVRIVSADYYSAPPLDGYDPLYNHFRASIINQLPVIRIFGITSSGEKACLHIHGVLPYLYVPLPSPVANGKENALLYEIADSLDQALNNSFGTNKQHVFNVSTLSAKPFYGYHSKAEVFVKILFYHPSSIKRAVSLLESGAVCSQRLQPHHAHVPYILQFFIDYNLYGMSYLNIENCTYRTDDEGSRVKATTCAVEVDGVASSILNAVEGSGAVNPGLSSIREEEERRMEEDGVSVSDLTPADLRPSLSPTLSDLTYRRQLSTAIKERMAKEGGAASIDSQLSDTFSSSQPPVTFDHEDMSVLKVLLGQVVSDDLPDDDSVLAATPQEDINDENEHELTQPYVSFIIDSDEEDVPTDRVDLWRSEREGVPQVDGNMDEEERGSRKKEKESPPRYAPLDVRLHRSPRNKTNTSKRSQAPTSPQLFRKLEENVSRLRSIKSPLSKVEKGLCSTRPSATIQDEDIIEGSDSSGNEEIEISLSYNLLGNSSRIAKRNLNSAKKALFTSSYSNIKDPCVGVSREAIDKSLEDNATGVIDDKEGNRTETSLGLSKCLQPVIISSGESKSSDDGGICNREESTLEIGADCSGYDHTELDTTNYSQCTIMSFYGDSTFYLRTEKILSPLLLPPSREDIAASLTLYKLDHQRMQSPFYSNAADLPSKYADHQLDEYQGTFTFRAWPLHRTSRKIVIYEPVGEPPSSDAIRSQLALTHISTSSRPPVNPAYKSKMHTIVELDKRRRPSGEIELATPNNSGMFKLDFQNLHDAQMNSLYKLTTVMVMEVHASTRGELRPDPEYDPVQAIFYSIVIDAPPSTANSCLTGILMMCPEGEGRQYPFSCSITTLPSELQLFAAFIDLVSHHNPDIIAGYEIEMLSWGYLIERGFVLGLNLLRELSRVKADARESERAPSFSNKDYHMQIPGRIVLNVWKLMRHEVALESYRFENVVYHVLHTRIATYSFRSLTLWWAHTHTSYRVLVLKHYLQLVDGIVKLLEQLNLVGRTSELASLFGIQFYEVFSRGSQFRVESMMLRMVKRLGFIAVSPSIQQRAQMRAPQSLPLIMEPESRFYSDPVIVLDFQSLYPSIIIAYNYCFSTCLGRVASLVETSDFKFGCTELHVPLEELWRMVKEKRLHVSPAGVAFVDKSVTEGVLPQMLSQILQTRLMVKEGLKRHKEDRVLERVLDARQLGLKLIANVTYGYTSANFSGRMPCIEVGDSVVSKGRETLERAIELVNSNEEWGSRVVYGDTDSMFVLCPGRTRAEAFRIGQQIADTVTAANPPPVKLKLEKVYQPCILQTKKRYVGYKYESADETKGEFDAKGIETVRRDGCPAASKILEKSLKLLFDTRDISMVKKYVMGQIVKVLSGRLSPAELSFAKEYRGMSAYQPNAVVPALKIAKELLRRDRRGEPRVSERVPYVVTCGGPGLPLISLVRYLPDFLADPSYTLNADYYISKAILPPLHRCFTLIGVDVFSWYSGLPKKQLVNLRSLRVGKRKATIAQYFNSAQCLVCGALTRLTLCNTCSSCPAHTLPVLAHNISSLEAKHHLLNKLCGSCCGRNYEVECISLDCPVYYRRLQASHDNTQTHLLYSTIQQLSQF